MNTPILLMLYKRPETTLQVINSLKKIKANSLYISISVPNEKKNFQDYENHKKVLNILKNIDWNCKIKIRKRKNIDPYTDWNSAIMWFFKNVKEGIILEDDTVPNKSFFTYSSKLLKKYRNNKNIAQICGTSFLNQKKISGESYFFSNYSLGWGWATWRRSIKDFDEKMKDWPKIKKKKLLLNIINDEKFLYYWTKVFDAQFKNKSKAWDQKWLYSNWKNNKISIIPKKHLVKNIGFDKSATHTKFKHWYTSLDSKNLIFKDKHPKNIKADLNYDRWLNNHVYGINFHFAKQKIVQNKILKSKLIFFLIRIFFIRVIKPIFRIMKPLNQ